MPRDGSPQLRTAFFAIAAALLGGPVSAQPDAPLRVIAEWEPAIGSLISWPLGIPQELVVELAREETIFVFVTGPSAENEARATLLSWGIEPEHMEFIRSNFNSHWTRDWGPHQVFDANGQWGIVDPIFEGYPWVPVPCEPCTSPGGHHGDDLANIDFAAHFAAPLHSMPAYLTGGNFLVDGHAAGFSTCVMVGENNQLWTEAEFRAIAEQYGGINEYHIVKNTEDYGIHHIDCWMKVLDEETLLIKRPPVWHEEYGRIEENVLYLQGVTNCYGRPYRIIRIDCPPYDGYNIAAYTNSVILNRKVYVPLFNIPGDAEALQTFADAMPGYEVIGFPWGSWYYYDALHCRVRAVFDRHMLRITHRRMDAEVEPADEYDIVALIDDRSEAGLIDDQLSVYYRQANAGAWEHRLLEPAGEADTYHARIGGIPAGATMEYYISAADHSGRSETLPRTAPVGVYAFTVMDTSLAIEVPDPPQLVAPGFPATFEVLIDPGVEEIVPGTELLHYRYDGGEYLTSPLVPTGRSAYEATLPNANCNSRPEYYVSVAGSDTGLKTAPSDAPLSVFAAAVGVLVEVSIVDERFESGLPAGWEAGGLWHVTDECPVNPPCDGLAWAYYGQDGSCNYQTGTANSGSLTSPSIELPPLPPGGTVVLNYCSNFQTEDEPGYDVAALYANGVQIDAPGQIDAWETRIVDLAVFAGESVVIEWSFDTVDDWYNDYRGWQVDAVSITAHELQCVDSCPSDVTGNMSVDIDDVFAVLARWGLCDECPEDVNNDGAVDVDDLFEVLGAWGPCP